MVRTHLTLSDPNVSDPIISSEAVNLALENINDIIVMVGPDGLLSYVSPSVRAFGYAPSDLIGLPSSAILHPEDAARALANLAVAQQGGPLPPFMDRQNRYRTAAGDWIWLEGSPSFLRGEDGVIVGMVNVLRDVSEHRDHVDLFEAAFRHAATGMVLVEPSGKIHRVNTAFCRMTGYDEAALLLTSVRAISDLADDEISSIEMDRLISGEINSFRFNDRYKCKDGGKLEAAVSLSVVRTPDGSPKYFIGQVQDLTDQRAAEASQRAAQHRYQMIAENTSDIIIVSGMDGVVQYVSHAIIDTGHSSAEMVGRVATDMMHPDDVLAVRKTFERLAQGEPTERVRWRGRNAVTGDWIWLESSPSLIRDPVSGAPVSFLDVVRNIDQQVAQEAALKAAQAAAEAATEAKAQFLANMSHEIRTPLTAIIGFANLLRETPELSEGASTYAQRIGGAGSALLAIVNDILDHTKLEAGKISLRRRPTDVAALAQETLDLFSAHADAKTLSLVLQVDGALPAAVLLDPDRVRQILINLVGNAVKFTPRGQVELRVEAVAPGDGLRFTVRDTGSGLDEAQQRQLFQRFSQLDGSNTREHGGTGLGLAICRGLVEAMGGEIGVDSTPGEGAAFWFTLSAPAAQLAADVAAERGLETLDDVRVLVVDDNAANRELASEMLSVLGAEVTLVRDGREALLLLAVAPMDIVLIDLHLPDIDGFGVLAGLRATPGPNRDIPALAFTAADAQSHDLSVFDGVVGKPFSVAAMAMTISAALQAPGSVVSEVSNAGLG